MVRRQCTGRYHTRHTFSPMKFSNPLWQRLCAPIRGLWWCAYPRQHLWADVLAGVVVAVLVLPQSMAYALLAGLPAQAGLYVSILPVLAYALVGSSMTQAVGPVAITAIVTFSVLSPIAEPGSATYLGLAAALALMSGLLVLAFGVLRLGFLASLLSRPVVSGFISGSAWLILISQLKLLLGVAATGVGAWGQLSAALAQLPQAHLPTVAMASVSVVVLVAARTVLAHVLVRLGLARAVANSSNSKGTRRTTISATAAVVVWQLDLRHGVAVVGAVKQGLPDLGLTLPGLRELGALVGPALILAFIGTVQNIAMTQALAIKNHERVNPNQELVGLGLSNVVASVAGGMPVGGGLSRTAINVAAGAQTPLASVVAAFAMLVLVWGGTAGFARIPLPVLAASIVVAALNMVDIDGFRRAWAYDRADALAWVGTALGVLVLGLQGGIVLGIALSLATLLYRASTPHIAVVGRVAGTEHFRNVERHGVETLPGVLFLRIDESIFFGNLRAIENRLMAELAKLSQPRAVVLIMSAVNRVDLTGLEALTDLQRDLSARGVALHLAEVKGPVQDRMRGTALLAGLMGRIHLSTHGAYQQLMDCGCPPHAEDVR
jgi:sulfate permease, SulP family